MHPQLRFSFQFGMRPVQHLLRLIHSLSRLFKMSTLAMDQQYFPTIIIPNDLLATLQIAFASKDPNAGPVQCARLESLVVLRIRVYKENDRPRHEYAIAEFYDTVAKKRRYSRVDRHVCDRTEGNEKVQRKQRKQLCSSCFSKGIPAQDHVLAIPGWCAGKDLMVLELDCKEAGLLYHEWVAAAAVTHNFHPNYTLLGRQCFWFADTVAGVLETSYPRIRVSANHRDQGRFIVQVHERNQTLVNKVCGDFRRILEDISIDVRVDTFSWYSAHAYVCFRRRLPQRVSMLEPRSGSVSKTATRRRLRYWRKCLEHGMRQREFTERRRGGQSWKQKEPMWPRKGNCKHWLRNKQKSG